MATKYDSLRAWRLVTARQEHECGNCGNPVEPKEQYWVEYLEGRVRPPFGIKLGKLCESCYARKNV